MWNKILLFSCLFSSFVLFAQRPGAVGNPGSGKKVTPAYKRIKTNEPGFKIVSLNETMAAINTVFAENTLPPTARAAVKANNDEKNRRVFPEDIRYFEKKLLNYMKHPDFEEASGIRRSWYLKVIAQIKANERALLLMDEAVTFQKEAWYQAARKIFLQNASGMKMLLKRPERIPAQEFQRIRDANIKRRREERAKLYRRFLEEQKGKR